MMSLSINQALEIWKDLEDARNGESRYAGDTCEIYAYRLIPYSGAWEDRGQSRILRDDYKKLCALAAENLTAILRKFEEDRNVKITVEDDPYDADHDVEPFSHRVHVTVSEKDDE